jgi:hypothetical protein
MLRFAGSDDLVAFYQLRRIVAQPASLARLLAPLLNFEAPI